MIRGFLFSWLFLFAFDVIAQSSSTPSITCADSVKKHCMQWANFGFGMSPENDINDIEGMNLGVNYNWMKSGITYQAGLSGTSKIISGASQYVLNAGIGKSYVSRHLLIGFIAGPGLMWGKTDEVNNDLEETRFVKPGLAINAGIIFRPVKNFGIGCEFNSQWNTEQITSGLRFVIHLNNN